MVIEVIPVGPLAVNCSVVADDRTGKAIVIDPGADAQKIIEVAKEFEVIGVLNTHGHIDHVGQVKTVKEYFNVPFYLHKEDLYLIEDEIWEGFSRYIGAVPCPPPDEYLEEGMEISVGDLKLRVLHTPGHTPGLCCFYIEDENILIAGDLLFKGSIGRTDLPGGNPEEMKASLKRVFTELPDETIVICGHYEETTIGHERKFNPYLHGGLV
ncbi:MBL fold metallo-hydrolase [Hydrogenivirga caldilitoris]|nr:MBL fold metallo-hydrolase [Hydrogenivirga caldilitoris]